MKLGEQTRIAVDQTAFDLVLEHARLEVHMADFVDNDPRRNGLAPVGIQRTTTSFCGMENERISSSGRVL